MVDEKLEFKRFAVKLLYLFVGHQIGELHCYSWLKENC